MGTFMVGVFAHPDNVNSLYGTGSCGVVYGCVKRWEQLAAQTVICIVVILWAAFIALVAFGTMMVSHNDMCQDLHLSIP